MRVPAALLTLAVLAAASAPAAAAGPKVTQHVLKTRNAGSQHVVSVVPADAPPGVRYPALLAFPGLGEVRRGNRAGAWGWVARYGLVPALEALARGSLTPDDFRGLLGPEAVAPWNAALQAQPWRGLVIVCPHGSLKLGRGNDAGAEFERYVIDELMPWAEANLPIAPGRWGVDGVSLGGRTSTWLGLRHPDRFVSIGSLQGALSGKAGEAARRLAEAATERLRTRALNVVTSQGDGYRDDLLAFDAWLTRKGLPHRFSLLPGRHDKRFVQGPGALEMLLFHERALHGSGPLPPAPSR